MLFSIVKNKNKSDGLDERFHQTNLGREITEIEQVKLQLDTLLEILFKHEVINNKEYLRTLAKNTNEYSKATAFQERDSEI